MQLRAWTAGPLFARFPLRRPLGFLITASKELFCHPLSCDYGDTGAVVDEVCKTRQEVDDAIDRDSATPVGFRANVPD